MYGSHKIEKFSKRKKNSNRLDSDNDLSGKKQKKKSRNKEKLIA